MTRHLDIERLAELRATAKVAPLSVSARVEYLALREAFFDLVRDAQNAQAPRGKAPRAAPRSRRALQVELLAPAGTIRVLTLDVGVGGFSALLPEAQRPGATLRARIRVSSRHVVEGVVTVVSARRRHRAAQVSFALHERYGDWAPFEDLLVDDLLASLAGARPKAGDDRGGVRAPIRVAG